MLITELECISQQRSSRFNLYIYLNRSVIGQILFMVRVITHILQYNTKFRLH